jgi:1,4-alpha-glucan branching enzyme
MGAMNKSLMQFFKVDPSSRRLDALTEGMKIDPEEHIVQVTSHDESANGKGSLRGSMAGDLHQKFASLRLYHAKVMSSPGIKLTMMGNEIGQEEEWSGRFERHLQGTEAGCSAMDWGALEASWDGINYAKATQDMVKDLNKIYLTHPALKYGNKGKDFKWIKADDTTNQVMSFHRTSEDKKRRVMCIQNYSDKDLKDYKIILPNAEYDPLNKKIRSLSVLFSTDEEKYGGKGREITPRLNQSTDEKNPTTVCVNLPPSTAIILEEELSS